MPTIKTKYIASFLFVFTCVVGHAQHTLDKIWETDNVLLEAESVLLDNEILYVSLVDGLPIGVDGKGGIAKLDTNGKILDVNWVSGLNAPKGLGQWDKNLYVTDITKVIVIDKNTGTIIQTIAIEDSKGLNDITVDSLGTLYVSDSELGNVHRIKNGTVELFLNGLTGANGLKAVDNDLYVLTKTDVLKIGPDKRTVSLAKLDLGGDGIEPISNGEFIITSWVGMIYYLDAQGNLQTLQDTRGSLKTADICYNPKHRILYVPTLQNNTVVAYHIK